MAKKLSQAQYRAKWAKKYSRENKQRAEQVRQVLNGENATNLRTKERYGLAVTDLLANIRHFCDSKGLDFGVLDNDAYEHYSTEVVQARTGVTQ